MVRELKQCYIGILKYMHLKYHTDRLVQLEMSSVQLIQVGNK